MNTLEEKARDYYPKWAKEIDPANLLGLTERENIMVSFAIDFHESQSKWISVDERLPDEFETVWLLNNDKNWVWLGCRVADYDTWAWAESNGSVYMENRKIVSECDSEDLDVTHWQTLPRPPKV